MSRTRKAPLVTVFVLFIVATLFGCSLLLRDGAEQSGWYIKLNINHPTAAKAITVSEYDVTGLAIEVYDPHGVLIEEISWQAEEGQKSYLIPVSEQGQYKVVVTHISEKNGETVEAEESALFNIQATVITVIDIIPGCIGLIDVNPGGDDSTDLVLCDGWGSEPTPDLVALLDIFADANPSVNIIRYTNPDDFPALITTGVADSFWVGAGQALIGTWVQTGDILPVTSIFNDNDWLSNYRSEVIDLVSQNGEIWSVPFNIHRLNVLWYNKQIFVDNSLTPPVTLSDFFTVASDIGLLGITPLAISSEGIWAVTLLFESVLLAYMDPAQYRGLWNGTTDWDGTEVQNALNNVVDIFSYVNTNHADIEWVGAAQLLADGDAAMFIMGDWTNSFLKAARNLTPNVDYGWAPSPGTSGSYLMSSGSFAFCANAPNSANAVKWLTICGSKEGQDAFNPIKGSIPARTDYNPSLYDEYLLDAMDDYAVSEIVPISWGGAANDNWAKAIRRVIDKFVVDIEDAGITKVQAVSTAQAGLVQAYIDYGN